MPVLIYQNGGTGFIERDAIPRNVDWVDQWKVFLSGTASEHGGQADKSGSRRVFSRILIGRPGTACTETYLTSRSRLFRVGHSSKIIPSPPATAIYDLENYDAKSNGWRRHARMPTARHGLGAAAVAGRIYVISGGPTPGDSVSAANEIFEP